MRLNPALDHPHFAPAKARRTAGNSVPLLAQNAATAALFCLGALVWVCQPKYAMGSALVIPISPPQIALSLGGLLGLVALLVQGRGRLPVIIRMDAAAVALLLGIGCVVFGIALHVRPGRYLLDALQFLDRWLLPVFAILTLHLALRCGAPIRSLILGICAGLAVTVLSVELAKRGAHLPVGMLSDGRFSGFLNHPNQYGILVSTLAPFLVVLAHDRRSSLRWLALPLLAAFALGLAQSLSKTNFALFPIALALTSLVSALGSARAFFRSIGLVLMFSVLMLGASWLGLEMLRSYAPRDAQIVEEALLDPTNASTVEDREEVWLEAWQYLQKSPWIGKGPGWSEDHLTVNHAHNLYLQIWLDAGLAGFVGVWLLTVGSLARLAGVARQVYRAGSPPPDALRLQVAATVGMLISILGNSMSSSFHTATFVPFALLAALSLLRPELLTPQPANREDDAHG